MDARKRKQLTALVILCAFVAGLFYIFTFAGEGTDVRNTCDKKCNPRFSRVIPDPAYLPKANGKTVPLICECY